MFDVRRVTFSIAALVTSGPQLLCGAVEAYHPGYAATHVTRLHRYEHSGLAAMLQAEALWSTDSISSAKKEKGFVQLSKRQHEALQRHHQATMVQLNSQGKHERVGFLGVARGASNTRAKQTGRLTYHDMDIEIDTPIAERLSSLDSQYVGPIGVGTILSPNGCAPQTGQSLVYLPSESEQSVSALQSKSCHVEDQSQVWVVFDTGSTNIWVSSDLCRSGACVKPGRKRYDHEASTTYAQPENGVTLNIQFGTGSISGPQAVDDFHIGPFTVYNQTFGMIQTQEGAVFDEVPFEGILGLAFPEMSANGVTPFFDNILQQKALKNNEFAFYFSHDNPASNAIFWGGVDQTMYTDQLAYYNVTDPYYWSLPLVSFKIGNKEHLGEHTPPPGGGSSFLEGGSSSGDGKPKAIVDTGTTFFTAEGQLFDDIITKLPSAPCKEVTDTSHPPITYTLRRSTGDDFDFVLNNRQYMTSSNGEDGTCSPAFMRINIPAKHGPAMVLGEVFLRHFFSVFDRQDGLESHGRIGFAPSSFGDGVEKRLKELTKSQPAFQGTRNTQ